MYKYLQRIGKSLMMPVAVLPAAAVLMGIGYWILGDPLGWSGDNVAAIFLIKAGSAIIDQMAILFAVGVAYGMSKDKNGGAALAGLVAFLTVTTLCSVGAVTGFMGELSQIQTMAFSKIGNQFIGILSGCIAAGLYNRFHETELPDFLAFFSGRRLVPILTSVVMCGVSVLLMFIWPPIYSALVGFGEFISGMGAFGAGLYGFFNRLLIPVGLHHTLNSVFWFDFAGISDLLKFWGGAEGGVVGETGRYMAGYFPVMMFGLPGACLAMYKTAKSNKAKMVYALMVSAAFASFFTGVTEPIEFSFMFVAPLLYVVHALLTGISLFICATFQWFAGFGFSAGFIDLVLSIPIKYATNWYMLIVLGIGYFFLYYFLFKFLIIKFNLKTPGREDDDAEEEEQKIVLDRSDWNAMAAAILEAIGGAENLTEVDNCATRLRLGVKDSTLVRDKAVKAAGATGVMKTDKTSVQVVIGPKVQFVADAMKKLI